MNYKQKYKEALERAKYLKENTDSVGALDISTCFEQIFPELRESEDERIRKALFEHFGTYHSGSAITNDVVVEDVLTWLEKQGEKETLCDKCRKEQPSHSCQDITALERCALEKQGEQKPTNKAEPKFKVGDWITNGEYTWKVTDIKPLDYILQLPNGVVVYDATSYVNEHFHLWNTQDAKDGDVLADEKPFIFRGFGDREHPNNPTAYCGITTSGTFILSTENEWWTADDFYPATKEQRDLLFQKMKEAGYVWDAEKKELKKIEQKSAEWSEEDKEMLKDIISGLKAQKSLTFAHDNQGNAQMNARIDWLQSLPEKFVLEPNQEWSEEDEKMCQETIDWFEKKCFPYALESENPARESIAWLKSLKPNHWKPSEEQMEAIKFCCANFEEYDALKSLYNDLKTLI